jgi:CheY-like chemotaxis protein
VLLVEDNEFNRVLAKSFLQQAHIEVTEAENGAVAVELARSQAFDLVLMDVQMPIMNGFEATEQLRKELELEIPIIALTANAIRGDHQKCLSAGMNDYLAKPFHENELLKIVHDWLVGTPKADLVPKLYSLDILNRAAHNDQSFVSLMLQTFLTSAESILLSLRMSCQLADMSMLKAAAHKIKPSLAHLQIAQVLVSIDQLEKWEGEFDAVTLEPLVELVEQQLTQVMQQIRLDLKSSPENAG